MATLLWPSMLWFGTTCVTRSTITKGNRWGSTFRIWLMSSVIRSFKTRSNAVRSRPLASTGEHAGDASKPADAVDGRIACYGAAARNISDDPGLGGDLGSVADPHVIGDPGLAADS